MTSLQTSWTCRPARRRANIHAIEGGDTDHQNKATTPIKDQSLSSSPRTWGERLLELVGLVSVLHSQGVKVAMASDLELGHLARLLDLDGPGVLPPGCEQELLNLRDLLRLSNSVGR